MTSIADLIAHLRQLDVRLTLDGDRLSVNAPEGILTSELRVELQHRREDIKSYLRSLAGITHDHDEGESIRQIPRLPDMPVSHTQQRLWFLKQMDPSNPAYNVPGALRIEGTLNVVAIERALAELVARHESLRTRFVSIDGRPRCRVEPDARVQLEQIDLSGLPEADRENEAMRLVIATARKPFAADACPLLHTTLLRLAANTHIFCFVFDHVIADGLSIGIFLAEIEVLYTQHVSGAKQALTALPVQYLDYAEWQRNWLARGALREHLAYWKQQLSPPPAVLQLPTDRPRPMIQTSNGARAVLQLPLALTQEIKSLARREGVTLFMLLLGAFLVLMRRYSGQTDISVGTVIANRNRAEVEGVIGFFANNIVMRGDLSGNPTVSELIAHVHQIAMKGYAHQDMPFDMLVEALAPRRELSHSPLFQVMFVLQNLRLTRLELPGLDCRTIEFPMGTARFDLSADVFDLADGLRIYFEYNTDLFDAATIERQLMHYRILLEGFIAQPEARIDDLPMLGAAEREQLTVEWNRTAAPYPVELAVNRLIEEQVSRNPGTDAVRFAGSSISYAALNARANQLARHLRALGIGRGACVAVCLPRCLDMVVALLGVLKSGGAYVPVDPGFPADRIAFMLADSGASVLLTAGNVAEGTTLPMSMRVFDLDLQADALAQLGTANLEECADPRDAAYVIYTSGSTGRPKGVAVPHGAVVNFLCSMQRQPGLMPGDTLAAVTTISFDIAALELFLPLTVGARIELVSRETAVDGEALAALLVASGATVLQATPATWRLLLEAGWPGRADFRAFCGGEPLAADLANDLLDCVGELWNLYGPTETTVWSTAARVERGALVTIGRPIANTQIYVVDGNGQPVPVGISGEIWIGGAGVALGYHRRPELTAERFVADQFSGLSGARLYRTGDLGRWRADGVLEHLGRIDHQVKIRGFRIELGEIETMLATHDAVRQAVVIARESAPGDMRLVAYVVYEPGEDLTASDVRRHLRRDLPDYMIPSVVVALDAIPLTPNSKVDRAALPDPFKNAVLSTATYLPPLPGAEQLIAEIWQDILQIEKVGAEDNFFEIGGHSLLSLRVVAAVEKRTGWRMDPRTLFFQNLRQLAAACPPARPGHDS